MTAERTTVAVLDGGRWARALAMNLCCNQDRVEWVLLLRSGRAASENPGAGPAAPEPGAGPPEASAAAVVIAALAALAAAELLFVAVPAAQVRQLLREVGAA